MVSLLRSGQQAWDVLAHAHDYKYIKPDDCSEGELDQLAAIFDTMTDWAGISGDLLYQSQQRDAQRSLSGLLEDAEQIGFAIFGGTRRMLLTGGVEPPSSWYRAVIYVVRKESYPRKDNISLRVTWG